MLLDLCSLPGSGLGTEAGDRDEWNVNPAHMELPHWRWGGKSHQDNTGCTAGSVFEVLWDTQERQAGTGCDNSN